MKKRTLPILIAAITLCCATPIYLLKRHSIKTEGFCLSKITVVPPLNPDYTLSPLTLTEQRELACALAQEYYYLGRGGQCFAFASQDNRYVIKFIRQNKKIPPFYSKLPLPSFLKQPLQKKMSLRHKKQQRDFQSYLLSMAELKEKTGMIFLHLNQTKHLRKNLVVFDKIGKRFNLNLDDYEFLVQKKGELIYDQIDHFMQQGQISRAEALISSIIKSVIERSTGSIMDDDAKIHRNFGCIEEQCIFIDVGRFRKEPRICDPKEYTEHLHAITRKFSDWLDGKYPELKEYLEEHLKELQN
jgi:hypothetical protein